MVFEEIEAEVQRILGKEDEMFVSGITQLRSLRRLLQEQKDFNEILEGKLKRAKEAQMMIQVLLNRMEEEILQQFEKVSAIRNQMFRKNVEVGQVAESRATSSGYHKATNICLTEDIQEISTDDEHENHLVGPSHPRQPEEHPNKQPKNSTSEKKRKKVQKGNSDSGQLNTQRPKTVRKQKSITTRLASIDPRRAQVSPSQEGKNDRKKHERKVKSYSSSSVSIRKPAGHFCRECNWRFNSKYHLTRHLRIHTGERPFKCNICNKRFNRNCILKVHLRTHTDEKPHKCEVCNTFFRVKASLSTHLMIHVGNLPYLFMTKLCEPEVKHQTKFNFALDERPFECDICKATFRQKSNLSYHMTLHSGRRPYKCKKCQKTFRYSGSLRYHRKVHIDD